jgi:hypothetical protein
MCPPTSPPDDPPVGPPKREDRPSPEQPHREFGPGGRRGPERSGGGFDYPEGPSERDALDDELDPEGQRAPGRAGSIYDPGTPPGTHDDISLNPASRQQEPRKVGARGLATPPDDARGGPGHADARIRANVEERLAAEPELDAAAITVSVSGGTVTLSGEVASKAKIRTAVDCAEVVSGVERVHADLAIRGAR